MTRREWLVAAGALAAAARADTTRAAGSGFSGTLCFFSKHLPELAGPALGRAVKDMGFGGVDLTVRPGGHVVPSRVTEDLPRTAGAIRDAGIDVPMITTAMTSATDPTAAAVFATAARLNVRLIKLGYWRYALADVRKELADVGRDLAGLAALARDHGVTLGFHNHADYVGAAIWDIAPHIDPLDEQAIGYYYDPRHAVVEGGGIGWKTAFGRVAPRLKMVAVKDFYWEKQPAGWRTRNCPLGRDGGLVVVRAGAGAGGFPGPVSVHFEYRFQAPRRPSASPAQSTTHAATWRSSGRPCRTRPEPH